MYQGFIKFLKKIIGGNLKLKLWVTVFIFLLGLWVHERLFSPDQNIAANAISQSNYTQSHDAAHSADPNAPFQEGKHFQKFSAKITTNQHIQDFVAQDAGKVQVIEFFNYGCFWCRQLHPVLTEWGKRKPENVVFYRHPVIFNKIWESLGKSYLVVKALNKTEQLDPLFFTEIHQNHVNLADEKSLKEFLAKQSIAEAQFFELYNSFAITTELNKINALGSAYQITLSPSIVINTPKGSYLTTASMAGGDQKLLELIDFIVKRDS